jgi:hypothetical protein
MKTSVSSKKKKSSRGKRSVLRVPEPPELNASIVVPHTFRYTVSAGGTYTITRDMMLQLLVMQSAANTALRMVAASRLRRVEIWDTATSTGALSAVNLEWSSGNSPPVVHSDVSVGSAAPLYVTSTPPAKSFASFWSLEASTGSALSESMFTFSCSANAVIDVHVELVIQNRGIFTGSGSAPAALTTTTAGTVGFVYAAYLDGIGGAGAIIPVGYSAIH